jgi:hypothetical protein
VSLRVDAPHRSAPEVEKVKTPSTTKKLIAGSALVLAGFGAGAAVAVTGSASAAGDAPSAAASEMPQRPQNLDPSRSIRPDEKLLTGTTADKVRAAALAKYPKATIQRVETDSDGVYEAHVVTAGGQELTVQVGKDFTLTGTQTGGPGGHRGDHDGDGFGDHGA